jgi:uncharacterized protein (DUF433 family)
VHYWARKEIVVPSVSRERVKLWSYADLFALRTVYWLRQKKTDAAGHDVPATAMRQVRRALAQLRELDVGLFHDGRPAVLVKLDGEVLVRPPGEAPRRLDGQLVSDELLDVIAPFETRERTHGVDLQRPSTFVCILPRRLSGSPHVVGTRIDTQGLAALQRRGFDPSGIVRLYPDLTEEQVIDALGVEERLAQNLAA